MKHLSTVAFFLCLLSVAPVLAADFTSTWDGSTGFWSDPTHWDTDPFVPNNNGFTFDVVIGSGTVTQDITAGVTLEGVWQTGGTITGGDVTITDNMTWTSGTQSGAGTTTIGASANLTISGSVIKHFFERTFANNGMVIWTAGDFNLGDGATFTNAVGAVFESQTDNSGDTLFLNGGSTAATFENAGTFRKSVEDNVLSVNGGTFNNTGLVEVLTGELRLFTSGGTHTGSFHIANGATLSLNSGTHDLGSATISGDGTFHQAGGTIVGDLAITDNMTWTSGTQSGAGTTTIGASANLTISGSVIKHFFERTFANNGMVIWTAGDFNLGDGATFTNAVGAVFESQTDNSGDTLFLNGGSTAATFENAGTFRKSVEDNVLSVNGGTFNNTGLVEVLTGELRLFTSGGTHTGSFHIANGATLSLNSGIHDLGSATISGDGTFHQAGGTIVGDLAITDNMTWTSGTQSGAGTTTIGASANLTISGSVIKHFFERTFANNGMVIWTAGDFNLGDGATFTNAVGAVFESQTDNSGDTLFLNGGSTAATFENAGTFRKSVEDNVLSVNGGTFNNTGLVEVLTGELRLFTSGGTHTGSFHIANGATARFARDFSGSGNFTGAGLAQFDRRYEPGDSTAAISFEGDVTFTSNARLVIELAGTEPGTMHDQLAIGGTATLGGTLELALDPSYTPVIGDQMEIIMTTGTGSISGMSDAIDGAQPLAHLTLAVLYEPDRVRVRASIPGDFDLDNDVDGDDFLIWQTGFGTAIDASWLIGDADLDQDVDGDDFLIWQTEFGSGNGAASATVPEPASIVLLLTTLVAAIFGARRR